MATVTSDSKAPAEAKTPSWKKIALYVVGGFVAFVALVVVFVNTASQEAVKASNQFVDNIQAGNATAAYNQFTAEAKATVPAAQFTDVVTQLGPILNSEEKVTAKEISKETGSDASAKVTYEISGSDSKTYEFVVNLAKPGDDWQILNFDSHVK